MRRTKMVCTIGPSSATADIVRQLIAGGMNVARLNFSHGSHHEHLEKIAMLRSLAAQMQRPVAILQDLAGPKIRVGPIRHPGIRLEPGQRLVLTRTPIEGAGDRVSVSYPDLPAEVKIGDRIMLADGLMECVVRETSADDIVCEVVTGGLLTSHKGVNLPSGTIKAPSLTPKDKVDLLFGLEHRVDFVALSFVRKADDIRAAKRIIRDQQSYTPVIAKIEKHEALDNIDDIIAEADGIMVARGDLGVEIPLEKVPGIQKVLIRKANMAGKPVIIATQMLRSMVDSPRPTRAEATDVANGVLDGADAVMLSEESASGDYPVEAVQYMDRIARTAEERYPHQKYLHLMHQKDVSEAVANAACVLADHLDASAIVATTRSGATARHISRFRPNTRLIALSPEKKTVRQLTLIWGCHPVYMSISSDTDRMIETAAEMALQTGVVSGGDTVVITAGRPAWEEGATNLLWVKKL